MSQTETSETAQGSTCYISFKSKNESCRIETIAQTQGNWKALNQKIGK